MEADGTWLSDETVLRDAYASKNEKDVTLRSSTVYAKATETMSYSLFRFLSKTFTEDLGKYIKGIYLWDKFEILLWISWDIAGIILRYGLDMIYRS